MFSIYINGYAHFMSKKSVIFVTGIAAFLLLASGNEDNSASDNIHRPAVLNAVETPPLIYSKALNSGSHIISWKSVRVPFAFPMPTQGTKKARSANQRKLI